MRITRSVLEVLAQARHPYSIITKSSLVERDIDLIGPMAAQRMAAVYVSITTLDAELARLRHMRGGKDNDTAFGTRMTGQGVWAQLLRQRFLKACSRLGLNRQRLDLDLTHFSSAGLGTTTPPAQGELF